ncbi:hypothetical protein [Erwinia amylovora]|nr:hypothetical protein [Erwinia amylovora]
MHPLVFTRRVFADFSRQLLVDGLRWPQGSPALQPMFNKNSHKADIYAPVILWKGNNVPQKVVKEFGGASVLEVVRDDRGINKLPAIDVSPDIYVRKWSV